ncbi:hypothetical protein D5038_09220 [Verminephrobacter aporrectodeae subsp. tuberculatae]|nr:hypothetical protein [Verminephrobacter aporrectodeae subsp. tuberculatae]
MAGVPRAKHGAQTFADLLILFEFKASLVHDGWAPYRTLSSAFTNNLDLLHHSPLPWRMHKQGVKFLNVLA